MAEAPKQRVMIVDDGTVPPRRIADALRETGRFDAVSDEQALDFKTSPNLSPMQQTMMMAGGATPGRRAEKAERHARKLPGKPKRKGGDKAKRKQAAKSRAKNRR